MKQTAVEWLREKLWKEFNFSFSDNILDQAKVMEKEHICNAYKEGNHSEMRGGKFINPIAEEYYNEKFKQQKQ